MVKANFKSKRIGDITFLLTRILYIIGIFYLPITSGRAFPIDQFKSFINTKPTIERFSFRVEGNKYILAEATNANRLFTFVYQPNRAFSLIENMSTYDHNMRLGFSGQFENQFWHRWNSNDVITAEINSNTQPSGLFKPEFSDLGIPLDALNFGILDLGLNGVTWNGMSFVCLSNVNGAEIEGQLALDATGTPEHLFMKYTYQGKSYQYRTSYEFDKSRGLPEFFPSEIKIEFVTKLTNVLISDYHVDSAVFSARQLSLSDVDYANLIDSNSLHFVETNGGTILLQKNKNGTEKIVPVIDAEKLSVINHHKERVSTILILITTSTLFLLVLYKTTKKTTKT